MEKRPFTELGLSPEILKAVDKMGFEEASPIQTATIPALLSGKDVVGQSATGSGKTAAFAIPAIEKVDAALRAVQVLVLCPTRELAVQVAEEVGKLAFFKRGVQAVPIYGGQSYDRQFRALRAGTPIVIGTPGRIMDHLERKTLDLSNVKMVVLDETDRMLDMGFREDIERILKSVPEQRQMMFFSATMPREIQQLIKTFAKEPEFIQIEAKEQNAPQVDQSYFEVDRRSKIEVLTRVIDLHDFSLGIIFCSTKVMVDDLADHLLSRGYSADRLHGDMSQSAREKTLQKFREKKTEFLVATDVAGRGLDVEDIEVVFNFDLPNDAEDYIHRIGRTARAGKSGRAITFVSGREIYRLQSIIRFTKQKIRRERVPSLDEVEEKRESAFFEELREVLDGGEFKKHDRTIDRLLEQGYASTDIASALVHMHLGGDEREPARGPDPAQVDARRVERPRDDRPPRQEAPSRDFERRERFERGDRPPPRDFRADGPARPPGPDGPPRNFRDEGGGFRHREDRGREAGMKRIYLNIGHLSQITPANIVGAIANMANVPGSVVGAINIFTKHTFVDVKAEAADDIVRSLQGIKMKGRYLDAAVVPEDS